MMGEEDYLITGKKEVDPRQVFIHTLGSDGRVYESASYPLDRGVEYIYHSRAGGFVPPEAGADSAFSQLHYGEGFFEGMRFYDSPQGVVLISPARNLARFMHSATVFHPVLARLVIEHMERDHELQSIQLPITMTPTNYFRLAEEHYLNGRRMTYPIDLKYRNGRTDRIEAALALNVACTGGEIRELTIQQLDAIIKVLAYTGHLVSGDYFPREVEMLQSGYIRPWGWVSGEHGLKVPSIIVEKDGSGRTKITNKPMYVAIATLPWGLYLTEAHYTTGLDVMVSPYPRIGDDMPFDAKIAGNYVQSAMSIHLGLLLGFGETLSLRHGKVVEGSAENVIVIMEEEGELVAYTPELSSGCLPGTTLDSFTQAIARLGMRMEERALKLEDVYEAKAVLLLGTGAQLIHVRLISEVDAAAKVAQATRLRSTEQVRKLIRINHTDMEGTKHLINGGERHEIVDRLKAAYRQMLLEEADQRLEPVYNINFKALAEVLRIDLADFTTATDRDNLNAGYFLERVNGLEQPDELRARHKAAARMIATALKKAPKPGRPLEQRVKRAA